MDPRHPEKQATLAGVSRPFSGFFSASHHPVTRPTCQCQGPTAISSTTGTSLHPPPSAPLWHLSSPLAETLRQKVHSSRKCPRPWVIGQLWFTGVWPAVSLRGWIIQGNNKRGKIQSCFCFPTYQEVVKRGQNFSLKSLTVSIAQLLIYLACQMGKVPKLWSH